MARSKDLGIKRLETVHFYINDLARGRSFWVDNLDFAFLGETSDEVAERDGVRREVYRAGDATYMYSQPLRDDTNVGRYLARHPDGVAELVFEVEDVDRTFSVLDERGAALMCDVQRTEGQGGSFAWFSIATAFGDTAFTFVQRDGYVPVWPGVEMFSEPRGGNNRFGFGHIDHVTSNFLTLKPLVLWCKDVLGLEEYWGIEFHTKDYATADAHTGSGLRSTVLWDPHSGVKFANNEPLRPFFDRSQIFTFVEDNHGPGVQHTALTIEDILGTVAAMREAGVEFMPTPSTYYDMLPVRLKEQGIEIDEEMSDLSAGEILVDGEGPGRYMLQIFAKDFASLFGNANGGPFFLEIIQRKGDRGFGGGNFRALFESIEREQIATGRI